VKNYWPDHPPVKYPLLTGMVRCIWQDSYGTMYAEFVRPETEWCWPRHAERLEGLAATLTEDEREMLACGEDTEQRMVVKRHPKVRALNHFLCEAFDGRYSEDFLKPYEK
jgi:hypothetical protein